MRKNKADFFPVFKHMIVRCLLFVFSRLSTCCASLDGKHSHGLSEKKHFWCIFFWQKKEAPSNCDPVMWHRKTSTKNWIAVIFPLFFHLQNRDKMRVIFFRPQKVEKREMAETILLQWRQISSFFSSFFGWGIHITGALYLNSRFLSDGGSPWITQSLSQSWLIVNGDLFIAAWLSLMQFEVHYYYYNGYSSDYKACFEILKNHITILATQDIYNTYCSTVGTPCSSIY